MRHGWNASVSLVCACVLGGMAGGALAQSRDAPTTEQPLQEVTVSAARVLDHKTLSHAVSGFVQSHSAPGTRINQIGRWHMYVCPLVIGLREPFNDQMVRDVLDVARGVGAPTRPKGKTCKVNVEIVFTKEPQALLDHIAKNYRVLLGYYPAAQMAQLTTFSRPIQAWYLTATHSGGYQPPIPGLSAASAPTSGADGPGADMPFETGGQIDSEETARGMAPSGIVGSYFTKGLSSQFVHVLIIADDTQLSRYPLRSVADYVALLSLTRMAKLDQCAPLPSITDLLASGCAPPVADSLTAADRAYLKALYTADLEKNLNLERGEVHDRMMRQIEGE